MLSRIVFLAAMSAALLPASIMNVSLNNTSDADEAVLGPRNTIFRTADLGTSAATQSGNTFSVTNHFAWMGSLWIAPGGATVANILLRHVAYDITFTVEDPLNGGYVLNIEALRRGFVTADWDSGSTVTASGSAFLFSLDSGSGFSLLTPLSLGGAAQADATSTNPSVNLLVSSSTSQTIGSFTGTRTFTLRASTRPSPNVSGVLQNNSTGQSAVRFGLEPTLAGFTAAAYPGADNEGPAGHGNFITISATMNNTAAVPEPATFAAAGMGLLALAFLRHRRAS